MEFKTTTVEQAYEATGQQRVIIPEIPGLPEVKRKYIQDELDLHVLIEAINQESNGGKPWVPDYEDGTIKYEPWFRIAKSESHPSGFVFSITNFVYTRTGTGCGSRFAFHSVNAWRHAVNTPAVIDLFLFVWTKKQ